MLRSTKLVGSNPQQIWMQHIRAVWAKVLPRMVEGETRVIWSRDPSYSNDPDVHKGDVLITELELVSFVEPPATPKELGGPPDDAETSPTGLRSKRLVVGTGQVHPAPDEMVEIHYSVWTEDGELYASSILSGKPAQLMIRNNVPGFPDFTEGVQLMVVGEKRRFWIPAGPPYQGTNEQIRPPNGKRVCDLELFSIHPAPPAK